MRRDRKSKMRKERMVMIASSALVMGALTLTGIYMKGRSGDGADDGYTVDFSQLENSVNEKMEEIGRNMEGLEPGAGLDLAEGHAAEDESGYDPLAAGSSMIQIPGLTDGQGEQEEKERSLKDGKTAEEDGKGTSVSKTDKTDKKDDDREDKEEKDNGEKGDDKEKEGSAVELEDRAAGSAQDGAEGADIPAVSQVVLDFTEDQGLQRPVGSEILMYYSMDKSIYFATLDQYKYHPALVFSAAEGDPVEACADAKVLSVYDNAQIGHAVTLDLGNGYQATYGQLKDLQVTEGSYVARGDVLGSVAQPTRYYTLEGPNLYFKLTKDGNSLNPETLFD